MVKSKTIMDNTPEQEESARVLFMRVEKEYPEEALRTIVLCDRLALGGFWAHVFSARCEIAKALLHAKGITV